MHIMFKGSSVPFRLTWKFMWKCMFLWNLHVLYKSMYTMV